MELSEFVKHYAADPKAAAIHNLLVRIERLEAKRGRDLYQLAALAEQIERKAAGEGTENARALLDWLTAYRRELAMAKDSHRRQFGLDLAKALEAMGLTLKGQYPALQAGLFQFKLNFDKGRCRIWYGPEQEALIETSLDAAKVADAIRKVRARLGSGLEPPVLLDRLRAAYRHARVDIPSGPVALTALLPYAALAVQTGKFRADPRKSLYREYGRADFSYDLYRLQGTLQLVTATRQQTRKHSDFLWVPTREDTESGGYFASINMEKE